MKRAIVLGVLVAAGGLSLTVAAFQQPPAGQPTERVVEVQKLKDNLFVLRGGGGASSVFVTANGVVVVDTKLPGWGQPLLDTIKTLTDRPVRLIVNTHTHGDHVSGNVEFPADVDIVTHQNTAANMKEMRPNSSNPPNPNPPNIFRDNNGRGLAKRTFTDRMTIGSGADQIELYYFGRAHTNGDAFVLFPAHRILHVADVFPGTELPIMDANNGGTGIGYADTLAKVASFVAERKVDTLVNGHTNAVTTPADLQNYISFIRGYVKDVQSAKSGGRSVDEFAKSWMPPAGYTAQPARVRSDAQLIFDETR
jgi:glyoxylase-like metal-dependent hydrolase (beta-lactamase superfamily II)